MNSFSPSRYFSTAFRRCPMFDSGVGKRNPPVLNVAIEELQLFPATRHNKVVRGTFVVIQKVVLDGVGAMAEAQNKVLMAEMRVVLHDVPENRPVANVHHGLGDGLRIVAKTHSQTATKQHNFHIFTPSRGSSLARTILGTAVVPAR